MDGGDGEEELAVSLRQSRLQWLLPDTLRPPRISPTISDTQRVMWRARHLLRKARKARLSGLQLGFLRGLDSDDGIRDDWHTLLLTEVPYHDLDLFVQTNPALMLHLFRHSLASPAATGAKYLLNEEPHQLHDASDTYIIWRDALEVSRAST